MIENKDGIELLEGYRKRVNAQIDAAIKCFKDAREIPAPVVNNILKKVLPGKRIISAAHRKAISASMKKMHAEKKKAKDRVKQFGRNP